MNYEILNDEAKTIYQIFEDGIMDNICAKKECEYLLSVNEINKAEYDFLIAFIEHER